MATRDSLIFSTSRSVDTAAERLFASWGYDRMPLYFFDTRDGEKFIQDDVGVELPDLDAVKVLAARSLAELARDVIPGSVKRTLEVEVRDEQQPVMEARLVFEAVVLVE